MGRGMVKPRKSITMRATVPYCPNVVTRSNRVSGFRDPTWCRVTPSGPPWSRFPASYRPGRMKDWDSEKGRTAVEVPVIIEPVTVSRYRVTGAGGLSVGLTAEGATAAEAIDRLADQIRMRVNAGAK